MRKVWKSFVWLAGAGVSISVHVWLSRGVLVAVPRSRNTAAEYLFVSANFSTLLVLTMVAWTCMVLLHIVIRLAGTAETPRAPLLSNEDTAYARPLLLFSISLLALLSLVPGLGRILTVWSYLIVDLRWWWTPLIVLWMFVRIDQRLGGPMRATGMRLSRTMAASRVVPEAAIVALAIAWVVTGTPHLRFSGITAGDEAKYLRYCELWYQGQGFELSHIKPIAELPPDYRPALTRNIALMAQTLPYELRSLVRDIGTFVQHPSQQFNKAEKPQGRFFRGKNGGVYQVHSPGISFLMFPAYFLDRQFGGSGLRASSQWPERLTAVDVFFLALYGVWVALVFQFLRRVVENLWAAWFTTIALMLTMPVATFPFQLYPEMAAGVILVWVAGHVLFSSRGVAASVFAGLLAGYLPWLHVRFSAMAMVLVLAGALLLRSTPRRAAAFVAGAVASLSTVALYAYHLTGSVLPWSMWQSESGQELLSMERGLTNSVGYLLDRDWGVFAHAPVYLLALPGYWLLARRRPDIVCLSAVGFLSLLLPAAAHTLTAAGSTPMRLIVSAVPFAAVPLAEFLSRRGRFPFVQVTFVSLLLLSLHTALAYNLHHYKSYGPLVDWSFSGWNTHLLFPDRTREAWSVSGASQWLLSSWMLVLISLAVMPMMRHRSSTRPWTLPSVAMASVALFLVGATSITAATGAWNEERFHTPIAMTTRQAQTLLETAGKCSICVSSMHGRVDTATMTTVLSELAREHMPPHPAGRNGRKEPPS